jgi:hypothetical protein
MALLLAQELELAKQVQAFHQYLEQAKELHKLKELVMQLARELVQAQS